MFRIEEEAPFGQRRGKMNKKLKKLIASLMLACMIAAAGGPFGQMVSWAADAKIAFSDPSVMVGNEVTVTMKVTSDTALGTAEIMLSYDPNVLEFVSGTSANGGAGAIKVLGTMESADQKAFNFQLKFKTLQAGNAQINVTSQEIYDINSQAISVSKQGNSTVKVTSPATYSKDASLKSLKISPGTLSPEFSPEVESYTAQVDGNTADLVVNAVAANAGARVALQGEKGLKGGENQVIVKVTAEDGQTVRNYTIQVTKGDGETAASETDGSGETVEASFGEATAVIDGTVYNVAASFEEASLPEGFEAGTYQYKGNEVMAGRGLEKELLLLYLEDSEGNGGFYIYNEGADSWSRFVQVETTSKAIVIIPIDEEAAMPEGFQERPVDIDGVRVTGWVAVTEAEPQYCLFYAMNWNGEKYFYRYDLSEKTIQRYFASGVSYEKHMELANTYDSLVKDYRIQFYILIGVGLVALILFAVLVMMMKKGNGPGSGLPDKNRVRPDDDGEFRDENFREERRDAPPSRIRRYTREEFENTPSEDLGESKNMISEDLREFESTSSEDRRGFESTRSEEQPEIRRKAEDEAEADIDDDEFLQEVSLEEMEQDLPSYEIEEDDDFEFIDLDEEE